MMLMLPRAVMAGLLTLLVSACGPQPAKAPSDADAVQERAIEAQTARRRTGAEIQDRAMNRVIEAVYLCNDGQRLAVAFDNPREMATVRGLDGQAVDLRQERAADGIWYRASGYDLRGKGVMATWIAQGKDPTECRAVD